jgi:spermidine dehydrogenase
VLACYNAIIPYLAPELPPAQKAALAKCVKRPMLVVNTLLRNGRALQALGIKGAQLPGASCKTSSSSPASTSATTIRPGGPRIPA